MEHDKMFWYNCICNSNVENRITVLSDPKVASLKEPLIKTSSETQEQDDYEPPEPSGEELIDATRPILQDGIFCKLRSVEQLGQDRKLIMSIVREKETERQDQLRQLALLCSVPCERDLDKDIQVDPVLFQKGLPSHETKVDADAADVNKNTWNEQIDVEDGDYSKRDQDDTKDSGSNEKQTGQQCDKSTLMKLPIEPTTDEVQTTAKYGDL